VQASAGEVPRPSGTARRRGGVTIGPWDPVDSGERLVDTMAAPIPSRIPEAAKLSRGTQEGDRPRWSRKLTPHEQRICWAEDGDVEATGPARSQRVKRQPV
jgi:hypothetical protein